MNVFNIETFATECERVMADAGTDPDARRLAAKALLERTLAETDPAEVVEILDAAIPSGADIGEMIVHTSPELTMLYARVPARFQSGIHNHTIFACIGQLVGTETSTLYRETDEGLVVDGALTSNVGEVIDLLPDAIHHIENPNETTSYALHIYGGDFGAVMDERSLWSSDGHAETKFSFPELIAESVVAMKQSDNRVGLEALAEAIPAVRPLVEAP